MIGHYLLTLDVAAEDRILTRNFSPVWPHVRHRLGLPVTAHAYEGGCRCLVLTANDCTAQGYGPRWENDTDLSPGRAYENLALRFGVARLNAAIRNRILSNRARRILSCDVPVLARSAEPHNE